MITIHDAGTSRFADPEILRAYVPGLDSGKACAAVDQASAMIARLTGRVLQRQDVSETWRIVNGDRLMTSRYPIASITSITVDDTLLTADEFEVDNSFIYRLVDDTRTRWNAAKITVRYLSGYDPIPDDIVRATLDLAANLNATAGRDTTMRGITIPDIETVSYRDESNGGSVLPETARAVIDSYRDYRL